MIDIEFTFRTGKITIDYAKCADCKTYTCVGACEKYGSSLFKLVEGKPALVNSPEETGRRCIEDLTCEIYCQSQGNKGLILDLDMFGLMEYRQKIGLS